MLAILAILVVTAVPTTTATSTPPYRVQVIVEMSSPGTTPTGIVVSISNIATGQTCSGPTTPGGFVQFGAGGNSCAQLAAGWWQASISPQKVTYTAGNIYMITPPNSTGVEFQLGQPTGNSVKVTITGVMAVQASSSITGNVIGGVVPGATYHISLLDPAFPGYVISSTNTTAPTSIRGPKAAETQQPAANVPLSGMAKVNFLVSDSCQIVVNGITFSNDTSDTFSVGSEYDISAQPCKGWSFSTWASNAGSITAPLSANTTITITGNGTLYANYTTPTASFTLSNVPMGSWTMYTFGVNQTSGVYNRYNYTSVSVVSPVIKTVNWKNVTLQDYLIWGVISTPDGLLNNATNVTIFDERSHAAYLDYIAPTGSPYYQAGLYPNDLGASGASQSFVAFVSPQGYSGAFHNLTVNSSSSEVEFSPAVNQVPSTVIMTNVSFTNISKITVKSVADLNSGGTFSQLPNASIGNLWSQLGLDFNDSNLGVNHAAFDKFVTWLNSSGPIYPAQAEGLALNSSVFEDNGAYTFNAPSFSSNEYYYSSNGLSYSTEKNYVRSTWAYSNASSYYINFDFNYPLSHQNLTYNFNLPQGYVLANGTKAPKGTTLVPSGPVGAVGRLWTSFTLEPQYYTQQTGTMNVTIDKIANVTAIVNVSSSNFAFSHKNVINQTLGNYSVIVGKGQNVSFTSSHSLIPPTMNVTSYTWNFGDGTIQNSTNTTVYHTYTNGGVFNGTLKLIASGGTANTTKFVVYVSDVPPVANISLNDTHSVVVKPGLAYVYVNWSQSLKLNATGSTDVINSETSRPGNISVASWNISAGTTKNLYNYTVANGSNVFSNFSFQFLGTGGVYYKHGTTIPGAGLTVNLTGWRYRVELTEWDAGGNRANATLWVLVNDTQKPIAIGAIQTANRVNITGGLVEGPNGTIEVKLVDKWSYEPNNGTLESYSWYVTNSAGTNISNCYINATKKCYWNSTTDTVFSLYLEASTGTYNFTLNVTTLADKSGNTTYPVTVAQNLTVRPVLTVSNLTAPTSMTDGTSYTIWANVNNTGFSTSIGRNITIAFYLTASDGTTGRTNIGGSPSSVKWYGYTSGSVNSSYTYTDVLPVLKANESYRAEITYTPSTTGSLELWANGTAQNEFVGEYKGGANVAHFSVTINANPLTQDLEYAAIGIAIVVILVAAVLFWRRRQAGPVSKKDKKQGKQDSKKEQPKEEESEEEDKS